MWPHQGRVQGKGGKSGHFLGAKIYICNHFRRVQRCDFNSHFVQGDGSCCKKSVFIACLAKAAGLLWGSLNMVVGSWKFCNLGHHLWKIHLN